MSSTITQLYTENLVPIYLLEQKLKTNFTYIQSRLDNSDATIKEHFQTQQLQNVRLNNQIASIQDVLATIQPLIERRVEDKITQALGLAISSKISEYYDKAASNEQTILRAIEDKVNRKANQIRSDLKVEIARDTEAMLNNQLTDFRKTIRSTLATSTASHSVAPSGKPSAQSGQAVSAQGNGGQASSEKQRELGVKLEEQQETIQDLRKKIDKTWDLTQTLQREAYDHQTELGEHIKSVMDMLEDYKACNNKNIENFKIEFFRLKNSKAVMQGAKLDKVDDIFKSNLLASLDDITKNMTTMLPRTEFEQLHFKSLNKALSEHQEELVVIRKEMIRLGEIMAFTNQLSQGLEGFEAQLNTRFEAVTKSQDEDRANVAESIQITQKSIEALTIQCKDLNAVDGSLGKRIDEHRLDLMKMPLLAEQIKLLKVRTTELERICSYEDHMDQIHDVLDKEFVIPPEGQQPKMRRRGGVDEARLASVESQLAEFSTQVKVDIEEIRLLQAKKNELHEVWKAINILETRLEMLKGDDEAASAAKKQWTCLSCERNVQGGAQGKQSLHKNWDAVPMKKLQPLQSGGFGQKQASSKNIKPAIPEQRPQKIQRVREKYFSDTVKLPDILQDRLQEGGSREFRL